MVRRHREIVDLLIKDGVVTQEQLDKAREETKRTGLNILEALKKLSIITEEDILSVQALALGLPYMDLSEYVLEKELIELVPISVVKKYGMVPLFKIGGSLTVGMVDPQDVVALDLMRKLSKIEMVEPVLVSESGIDKVLDAYYGLGGSIQSIVKSIDEEKVIKGDGSHSAEEAEEAPIIKLVNLLITQAVKDKASDIHVEPEDENLRVRYRIDGILHEVDVLPKKLQSAINSRIKILSNLNIAEKRVPQDGRIRMNIDKKDLDVRVSTFPTVHGENIVMRLLDKSSVVLGLKEIGFLEDDLQMFNKLIHSPNGIILVTGPTGSGKTTTLYSALASISSMEKNIITIEDPVEYELPLIRQTQVNPKVGVTFANGLRSILRQDPDIIMVGEIRDKETADVAIQAALTGHLVFATLHTNDTPSALTRLMNMGIDPFLISSSVIGIIAQRLVRMICEKCKEKYKPPADIIKSLGLRSTRSKSFSHGKGCAKCKDTGYKGRKGIFEILLINEEIRKLIDSKKSSDDIKKKAIEMGMKILREDGLKKIKSGLTTPEEVLRVTEEET